MHRQYGTECKQKQSRMKTQVLEELFIESSKGYLNNLLKICAYQQIIDYHMVRRIK